jgi:hypothetical protein
MEQLLPKYRYALAGKVISSGYKSIKEFCNVQGLNYVGFLRCVQGKLWPSAETQRKVCRALNITLKELAELL